MKKAVLIGCGAISPNHAAVLKNLEGVRFAAVCDTDPAAAQRLLASQDLSLPIYRDYREMLDKEKPDAVHICTPHFLHTPMIVEALGRDCSVFSEKPVCMKPEEFSMLAEAEKKSRGILCTCFQNRFLGSVDKAREILAQPETGPILGARGFVTWKRGGAYYTESPWRGKKATEGGGVLINQAIHTLDLMLLFLGEPVRVQGAMGTYTTADVTDTEDTAHLHLTFPDGKMGLFYATNCYCRSSRVELEIACEKRLLRITGGDKLYVDNALVYEGKWEENVGKAVWGNGHGTLIRRFYRALEEGGPSPVPLESAGKSLRVLWELYAQCQA